MDSICENLYKGGFGPRNWTSFFPHQLHQPFQLSTFLRISTLFFKDQTSTTLFYNKMQLTTVFAFGVALLGSFAMAAPAAEPVPAPLAEPEAAPTWRWKPTGRWKSGYRGHKYRKGGKKHWKE
ncbi:hypothetical protein TWF569_002626 [Orbilia oligospora]|uniref:Uncharacterized protein n=1 Tax=Orbilia oligospora TaxID=2813651 RepID=A0A7C8JDT8_ORBOL|nr:hypothetical protein TWF706_003747 [Orbilia oligospora]KAF3106483.1 hypothetical protein TWF102_001433 [Orbilia oligospora]KAF3106607.1 hypothetical protein TWF103_006099 [Orbilia oligospora]KAF3130733.1 hypothetical protein TWF594_010256 [Orbilia oligospora]KAF3152800.1 hypothetical protein TWF569_002626 [Orbilia oligospora]